MITGLLQLSALDAFKAWLESQDIPYRPGKGQYEALQIFVGPEWAKLYHKDRIVSHLVVQERLVPLVRRFVSEASIPWEAVQYRPDPQKTLD